MSDVVTGGCQCRQIRYRARAGDSKTVTHCYCRMCRKLTGGTFVTYAEFPADNFAYAKGKPRYFKSSDFGEREFCGSCGCHIAFRYYGEREEITNSVWVTVGSLDHPEHIKPTDNIFTSGKLPWLHLDEELQHWPEQLPWLRSGVDSTDN